MVLALLPLALEFFLPSRSPTQADFRKGLSLPLPPCEFRKSSVFYRLEMTHHSVRTNAHAYVIYIYNMHVLRYIPPYTATHCTNTLHHSATTNNICFPCRLQMTQYTATYCSNARQHTATTLCNTLQQTNVFGSR